MRKLSLFLFFVLFGLLLSQGNVVEKKYAVVLKDANVRVMPTTKSQVLFTAKAGQRLELLEDLGTWVKIKTPSGLVGYIWAKLVRVEVERTVETPHPAQPSQPSQPSQIKPAQGPPSGTQPVVSRKRSLLPLYIAGGAAVAGAAAYILFRKGGLLNKGTATLHISSSPSEAKVYIDGQEKCETPCTVEKVEPGKHTIKVERELYGKWEQEMELKGHEEYNIEATLSPYKYEADFCFGSHGSGDGQFNEPWDVAIDDDGNIYVADHSNFRIQKFDSNGSYLRKLNLGSYVNGIRFSPVNKKIYITTGRAPDFHRTSKSLGSFDWQIDMGLFNPGSMGVDSSGNVYIADFGNDRIIKTNRDGGVLTQWSTGPGSEPCDAKPFNDDLYVSLYGLGKIKIYSLTGDYKGEFSESLDHPTVIAVDRMEHVYVVVERENKVYKFLSDGTKVLDFGGYGSGSDKFIYPEGIAVYENGDLVIADGGNHRICIWRLTDEVISSARAKISVKRKRTGSFSGRGNTRALSAAPAYRIHRRKPIKK